MSCWFISIIRTPVHLLTFCLDFFFLESEAFSALNCIIHVFNFTKPPKIIHSDQWEIQRDAFILQRAYQVFQSWVFWHKCSVLCAVFVQDVVSRVHDSLHSVKMILFVNLLFPTCSIYRKNFCLLIFLLRDRWEEYYHVHVYTDNMKL